MAEHLVLAGAVAGAVVEGGAPVEEVEPGKIKHFEGKNQQRLSSARTAINGQNLDYYF